MSKTIICIGGRCSTWGQNWKKHLYDGGEECLRCGMSRKEQFKEDKAAGLVTGAYVPNHGKSRAERPITSKQKMYCAVSEEGIEFAATTRTKCVDWIEMQREDNDIMEDYYVIQTFTKAEIAAMPEV